VRVIVPASAANLGPGFDILGLALDLVNTFDVWEVGDEARIEVSGEGVGTVPVDDSNLFLVTMHTFFKLAGYQPQGLLIREQNRIPLARGLGSSASTIVGALLAARSLSGYEVEDERLLDMAGSLEGHPDNSAAAFRGGLQLAVLDDGGRLTARSLDWPSRLAAALFVPELLVSTGAARAALPEGYPRADVVHNLSRLALLLSALQAGRLEDLSMATQDRLHQPYRAGLVPGLVEILAAARDAGATGTFLSGAGPTMLALHDRAVAGLGGRIAAAMDGAAGDLGLTGQSMLLDVRQQGAECLALPGDPAQVPLVT
jgi:homoserine kinase